MRPTPRPRLTSGWLLAVVLVCLAGAAVLPAQTGRTQERDVLVSVLNQAGQPVLTLDAPDFVVREDKLAREVLRVRRATDPIDLAIVVDNSEASTDAIMDLRRALAPFVKRMAGAGQVSLITVADRPTRKVDFTGDAAALEKAASGLFPVTGSGAMVLEGLSETLAAMKPRAAERAAVVVIWLGGPEFSGLAHLRVLEKLRDDHVALHVVSLGAGVPEDSATEEGRQREIVFDEGTRYTGGRRINVVSSMGLPDALARLGDDLTSQYRVTYARPDTLIPPDRVEVSVKGVGLTARGSWVRAPRKGSSRP